MATLYFPIFETRRFVDIDAMCAGRGLQRATFDSYITQTAADLRDAVVAFDITIGDPEMQMRPAAIVKAGQPVVLGLAMLSAARPAVEEVEGLVADCWRNPMLLGCQVHIGTMQVDVEGMLR